MSQLLPTPIEQIGVQPPRKANPWLFRGFVVALILFVISLLTGAVVLIWACGAVVVATGASLLGHRIYNQPQPARPEAMFSTPGHWQGEEFVADGTGPVVPPESPSEQTRPLQAVPAHSRRIFRRDLSHALKTADPDESQGEIHYSDRVNPIALVGLMAKPLSFLVVALTLNIGLLVPANRPGTIRSLVVLFVIIVAWELWTARRGQGGFRFTKPRGSGREAERPQVKFRAWLLSIVAFALATVLIPFGTWLLVAMLVVVTYFTVRGYMMWSRTFYVIKGTLFYRRRRLPWLFGGTDFKRIDIPKIDVINSDQSWFEQFLGLNSATLQADTPATGDEWATVRYIRNIDTLTNWLNKLKNPQRHDPNTKLLGEIRDLLAGQPPQGPQG